MTSTATTASETSETTTAHPETAQPTTVELSLAPIRTDDWAVHAACRGVDPDALFVQGAAQNRAKTLCAGCPVKLECLAVALDNNVEFGVWGGMTERERRALLRRRPDVTSWRRLLEAARREHESRRDIPTGPDSAPSTTTAAPGRPTYPTGQAQPLTRAG